MKREDSLSCTAYSTISVANKTCLTIFRYPSAVRPSVRPTVMKLKQVPQIKQTDPAVDIPADGSELRAVS